MIHPKRVNNFDLLRLLAAVQVLFMHAMYHLEPQVPDSAMDVVRMFHGVPIFFAISGFLIFQSYQRNSGNLRKYAVNRILRIYPGLVAAFLVSLVLTLRFAPRLDARDLVLWSGGQISLFQYYTPPSLRSYGVGTPNGSLWTIPVELEFYALLPLIYLLWRKFGTAALVLLFALSIASYNVVFAHYGPGTLPHKLFQVTVAPYLYNFLVGVLVAIYFDRLKPVLVGKGAYWLGAYVALNLLNLFVLRWWAIDYTPNLLGVVNNSLLSVSVISLAYTAPELSTKWLKGNDISYGIYIYHMPIMNWMVQKGFIGRYSFLAMAVILTTVAAMLSWTYVERVFLQMKAATRRAAPAPGQADVQW